MTDLTAEIQAARAEITETVPLLLESFQSCWDACYHDHSRERAPRLVDTEEPPQRAPRCGSCEHPDDHTPRCGRDGCRCHTWESWPSTVGWAEWTGPGKAEVCYTNATKELQRAHDAMGEIEDIPAHWASEALYRPGHRTAPMPIERVLRGVRLLAGAVTYVTDHLAPPEANALKVACEHTRAALAQLDGAQDRLRPDELSDLSQPRCVVAGCRVMVHAKGRCREHHDATRLLAKPCAHCRDNPPEAHRDWCARCRRGHAPDRRSCSVDGCRLNQKRKAS